MKNYMKNVTKGVTFLFVVLKELFKNHFINKFSVKKTKLGKRLLAGLVALVLIFATLLGDASIAYAVTDSAITSAADKAASAEKGVQEDKAASVENGVQTDTTAASAESDAQTDKAASENAVQSDKAASADNDEQTEISVGEVPAGEDTKDESSEAEASNVSENQKPENDTSAAEESSDAKASNEATDAESAKGETSGNETKKNSNEDAASKETKKDLKKETSENKDEDKSSEKMPAISIVKTVDDYEITLECAEGTFGEGTTVEIKKLEEEEKDEADKIVEDAIAENDDIENDDIVKIVTFDVTFYDKDGNEVEPADENSVSIKIVPSEEDKTELENVDILEDEELSCSVFHIEDEENVEEIECEITDPIEEIIFEAESFSQYSIVWYKKDKGDDGKQIVDMGKSEMGPEHIGDYIKSTHTFIDFNLPLEFTNEGNPVDISFRPEDLKFEIYGRDANGSEGEGVEHDEILICEITVPVNNYYNKSLKTISLKESGKTETEIPVYVVDGTQATGKGGNGNHIIDGFEYIVKVKIADEPTIYSVVNGSTDIEVSSIANQAEWSGKGNQTLRLERQTLSSQKFYISWVDNRNKEGERPYTLLDNFKNEEEKTNFKNSITLYAKVGENDITAVEDLDIPVDLEKAGPVVDRKDGKSISDWEITYNNLPSYLNGEPVKYYVTVDDTSFNDKYSAVMPGGSVTVGEKTAFLSGTTAKYIYSKKFTATVEWYDANNTNGVRLDSTDLAKKIVITDEKDKKIYDGSADTNEYTINWTNIIGDEWTFDVGPLPMYSEQGSEKSYKLVLSQDMIPVMKGDKHYEYSVDYSNVPKTAAHEFCLSEGKIILVIDRDLESFKIYKKWDDANDYAKRKETVDSGVRFLLWRYPRTKIDSQGNETDGTPADRAAVFDPETHSQYSYTLSMTDPEILDSEGHVKDSIEIDLTSFGVSDAHPVDMFDQNGYEYVYFATEVMSKSGYKTVYTNHGTFAPYTDCVMNTGEMTNVRQEKMKMEGIVKWNVPSVNDYTKTTVTIALQSYDSETDTWKTLSGDGFVKTLSGFTVTNPQKKHVFPEVEKYNDKGEEIKYRVVQTNINYSGGSPVDIPVSYIGTADPTRFVTDPANPFAMNGKDYNSVAAPTPNTNNSYTIENRLSGEIELELTKFWNRNNEGKGFGLAGCATYKNITIKVFQHGTSTNNLTPYMTLTTKGVKAQFAKYGVDADSYDPTDPAVQKTVPYEIEYRADLERPKEDGVIQVTTYSDGRAETWEFKKEVEVGGVKKLINISLPAFNENGNAYSYTVEESPIASEIDGVHTTYKYRRNGNELEADVINTYATGGGGITVTFQKEWTDGTDIPQEKPIRIAIVRINPETGDFYRKDGEIDLEDKLGNKHIIELTENNNWYGQCGISKSDECFDYETVGDKKKYYYTAIELDMARNGATGYPRKVNYDGITYGGASLASKMLDDINGTPFNEFNGLIDAYLDPSHEENHLPGYDVTVKATNSVVGASKYVVVNKRKGEVNVVFDKTWQDGSNSEGTRNGTYRVYLYRDGKKIVNTTPLGPDEDTIEGITSPVEVVYTGQTTKDDDTHEFKFMGLPQYDDEGNLYHYSVKEFLEKGDEELEIALTDTKDSSKTGYVVTNHSDDIHFSVKNTDSSILQRNDTYSYTNTITGEKTGGASFYVLWHDQTSYDKGDRPDVNYVLYYKAKGSDPSIPPQVYNGEYKVEWHPMYDDAAKTTASRFYQYVTFTRLPLANDEGIPYEYYAVPSLNNPGEHYKEAYYESNEYVVPAMKGDDHITTSANRYHYDIPKDTAQLPDGSKMLPENGIVEYIIDEYIHVEGNKVWRLGDSGDIDLSDHPDANIYLWRQNTHESQNSENPDFINAVDVTTLNEKKTGYVFKEENGDYKKYPKYDPYGLIYKYNVSEKIFINSPDQEKYKYAIPNYVMQYLPETNGITNVYNPDANLNARSFKVTKDWGEFAPDAGSKKPVAEFGLYRIEIPLKNDYYAVNEPDNTLKVNPKKDAYIYAIDEFKKFKAGDKSTALEQLGIKTITYSGVPNQFVEWDDMPVFAPSGLVYLYFAEEIKKQGIESFDYDVITDSGATRPSVADISTLDTDAGKVNVLVRYDDPSNPKEKVRAVLFSNYGLDPSTSKSDALNYQEAGYKNEFNNAKLSKIFGYKLWDEGIFTDDADSLRPLIDSDNQCSEIHLTLKRSADAQVGYGNSVGSVTIPEDQYDITWSKVPGNPNKWMFVITPKDTDNEFKLYAPNGRPYKYTVSETVRGNTLTNYTATTMTVSGSENNVTAGEMELKTALQNTLKGQIKVFKKWDDALNEYNLRSGYVKVLLQYRLVPNGQETGAYNVETPLQKYQWKNYPTAGDVYELRYNNKWEQTVKKLPVVTRDGEKYEYRLLETEFKDLSTTIYPIDINHLENVPNGGFCNDGSSDTDRKKLYGNSTNQDPKFHNKCYEVKIESGNYIVNNSAIASFAPNTAKVSSMELRVDNRLISSVALRIEKKWDGVNIGEPSATPEDIYGVLPDSLTFDIQYQKLGDTTWNDLVDDDGKKVSQTIDKNKDDNSFIFTIDKKLPDKIDGSLVKYRAIERPDNLGRFKVVEEEDYVHDALVEEERTVCHTTVTNTLPHRDITVKKQWNAEVALRKPVKVELWSDNFTYSAEDDTFSPVPIKDAEKTKTLSADNGWQVTYNNLPKLNTKGEEINYYVKEVEVGETPFNENDYAIQFYSQASETTCSEALIYGSDVNIAKIPADAYKMYIVNTPKTSLSVSKIWDDEDNRQGMRENVNVTLESDGGFSVPDPLTLTKENKYSATWNYLPMYKKADNAFVLSGKDHMGKVTYTIKEENTSLSTKGYKTPEYFFNSKTTKTDSGFKLTLSDSTNEATITNTYNPPKIKFKASKTWEDENNRHFSRPTLKGIYLTLYYSTGNGKWYKVKNPTGYTGGNYKDGSNVYTTSNVTQHVQGSDNNTWEACVWEGLPTKVSNTAIIYKVFETDKDGKIVDAPGYEATYTPDGKNVSSVPNGDTVSQEIKNKLVPTNIRVSKEWKNTYDVNDRPTAVTFVLEYRCGTMDSWRVYKKADGTVFKTTLTGTDHESGSANIWATDIKDLPKENSEGTKYEYRVKEISIAYDGNEVSAQNVSEKDASDSIFKYENGSWTSKSTVGIYNNSVATTSTEGGTYSYKVTAVNTPVTGELTVVKKWDDESNRDNVRPHEIRLQLYRKQDQVSLVAYGEEVVVGPGTTGNPNEWKYTFKNLPVYNNDSLEYTEENKSIYYVEEVSDPHGYNVEYASENSSTTNAYDKAGNILMHGTDNKYSATEVITNKYTPKRIKITAHKEWIDTEEFKYKRPEKLNFKLQYHIVGTPEIWKDVVTKPSVEAYDSEGKLVETTSALERTLQKIDSNPSDDKWEWDIESKPVVWENLPAFVNYGSKNGVKVEYRICEYDHVDTTDPNKQVINNYIVNYDKCEYETKYGLDYSLRATNTLKGMRGVLEIDKIWNPDAMDDIAVGDMVISKIECHLEQRHAHSEEAWDSPAWGIFELSHGDNWQHIFAKELTTLNEYRVVEDAIVYKKADGSGTPVRIAKAGNKIGSFDVKVEPDVIVDEGEDAQMKATITNTLPKKSITVSKKWEDENNRDGKRTHSITVCLKRDGEQVGELVELYPKDSKVGSDWETYTWENLPIYKNGVLEGGQLVKSEYTVEEIVKSGSEFDIAYERKYKVDGGDAKDTCSKITFNETSSDEPEPVSVEIINRHETHKETITASKIWKDENDRYKTRLKKSSEEYHTYLMLLYKLEGHSAWHPVKYYKDYDKFEKNGYQYEDHHIYTTSPVIQEVTGTSIEKWENVATWENVSTRGIDENETSSSSDCDVSFMVIEVPGPEYKFELDTENSVTDPISKAPGGYTATASEEFDPEHEHVTEEHADITNTLITTELEVKKEWTDDENKFNTRPDKIKVKLERKLKDELDTDKKWNSVKQYDKDDSIIELSKSNNWTGLFDNIPLYDQSGKKYVYRAVETALVYGDKEEPVNVEEELESGKKLKGRGGNYITEMENSTETISDNPYSVKFKLSLTNTLDDVNTTSLTVDKKWKDENNRDRIRPVSITVNLLRDDVIVDTQTISGATDPAWEYKWDKLPKFKNGAPGKPSIYRVTEEAVEGYKAVISKPAETDEKCTITNIHIPKKAVIVADKVWEDTKNSYSTRPKEIYLRLLYKYAGESDSEYKVVPEYSPSVFAKDSMYTSEDADGVFTTSKATQKCTGKDDEKWEETAKWENLPLKATPNSAVYEPMVVNYKVIEVPSLTTDSSVTESTGFTGYEVLDETIDSDKLNTDDENKVNITNRLITTELDIIKVFEDEENKYNTRPDSIEVQVRRRIKTPSDDAEWKPVKVKGGLFGDDFIVTLTKPEAFRKKLTDIPKYDKDGNEYEYTCLERNLIYGDKKISVDKSNVTDSYTESGSETQVKNTLITTSLTVVKEWNDNSNARGARPGKVVFSIERKETKDIASEMISALKQLFTGEDGYSEVKMLKDGKEVPLEITIEGPEFEAYTLDGLPAYSEDGNPYSYRAIETKLVYTDREVLIEKETSLYEKPAYELKSEKTGKDAKGNTSYKYNEIVVNKIIPIKVDEPKKKQDDPEPTPPGPVIINPVKPTPKFEIIEEGDPELLPQKVTDKIYELIDLPEDETREILVQKLYNDLVRIIEEDPAFIDRLDEETADIVVRFLTSGVLGRRRTKLPKTGGVVGSVMAVMLGFAFIGFGMAIRPANKPGKKKRHRSDKKAQRK